MLQQEKDIAMNPTQWIATTDALPGDGQHVEFLIGQRACPLRGTFHFGRFCSKWIGYVPAVVSGWRESSAQVAWTQPPASRALAASGLHGSASAVMHG